MGCDDGGPCGGWGSGELAVGGDFEPGDLAALPVPDTYTLTINGMVIGTYLAATPERRAAGQLLAACEKAECLAEVAERVGRLGECGNDGDHAAAAVELFDLLAEFRAAIRAARGEADDE